MKKILSIMFIVVLSVALYACNPNRTTTTDESTTTTVESTTTTVETTTTTVVEDITQPVLSGFEDVSINVGDTFVALAGVTAMDDTDGDITANIEVFGTVNTTTAGAYTLRYKVTDAAGNFAQVYRVVTVIFVAIPSDDIIVNGDFSQGSNGWTIGLNEGGAGSIAEVNGELKLTIDAVGSTPPFPRIDSTPFELEKDKAYEVTFEARAEAARYFNVQVGELFPAAPWFNPMDQGNGARLLLSTEMQSFSFKFTMLQDTNTNVSLLFEFGKINDESIKTNIYIDNVAINETIADPDTIAPVLGGVSDITIELGSTFVALDGVTVTDNLDMTLTTADIIVTGETVDTSTAGIYTVTYTVIDASSNETIVNRVVTVVELVFTDTTKIVNGDFSVALDETTPVWTLFLQNWDTFAAGTLTIENEELKADLTSVGDQPFGVQVAQGNILFEKGMTYKLIFDVKADVERKVNVAIGIDLPPEVYWESFIGDNKTFDITTTYQTHEVMFTMTSDTTDAGIAKFELGNILDGNAATAVYFDNVKIQQLAEGSVITNGDASAPGWSFFYMMPAWGGSADASYSIENGIGIVDIVNTGDASWNVQFTNENITLENGKTYKISFDSKADVARYFEMPIGTELSGWAEIDRMIDINVTTDWVTYYYTFTYTGATVDYAKLKFELGQYKDTSETIISANGKVYFDNIKIEVQDETDPTIFTDTNEITNGTFDQVVSWKSWWGDNGSGYADGTFTNVDGVMVIDIQTTGTASYSPQVFQEGLTIKGNRTYTIEFDIKADVARPINVNLGESLAYSPWFNAFMTTDVVDVTTEWKHVVITFDMTQVTNINGKLVFEVGKIVDGDGISLTDGINKLYIDNVAIYPNFN